MPGSVTPAPLPPTAELCEGAGCSDGVVYAILIDFANCHPRELTSKVNIVERWRCIKKHSISKLDVSFLLGSKAVLPISGGTCRVKKPLGRALGSIVRASLEVWAASEPFGKLSSDKLSSLGYNFNHFKPTLHICYFTHIFFTIFTYLYYSYFN